MCTKYYSLYTRHTPNMFKYNRLYTGHTLNMLKQYSIHTRPNVFKILQLLYRTHTNFFQILHQMYRTYTLYVQNTTPYIQDIQCQIVKPLRLTFTIKLYPGNTKGGSITDKSVLQIKTQIVNCHTADSKPVKWEVNGTVILLPLEFPALSFKAFRIFQSNFLNQV